MTGRTIGGRLRLLLISTLVLSGVPSLSLAIAAEPPPFLWEAPGAELPESGAAAGELSKPLGVATDPTNGHIFVADTGNARVSEFDVWGSFVKAWGWGVRTGDPELQTCTEATGCLAGIAGLGPGQFSGMSGIAVDPTSGAVYVLEQGVGPDNFRVQKFASDGTFLLMFGGDVNKGPLHPGNLCTAAHLGEGDTCGAGIPGATSGQFQSSPEGTPIAVGSDGIVYVGDLNRVQEFEPDGVFKSQLPLPEGEVGRGVQSLAVDSDGTLYMTFNQVLGKEPPEKPYIYQHTPSGWEQFVKVGVPKDSDSEEVLGYPVGLAADLAGNIYVTAQLKASDKGIWQEVLAFAPSSTCILCPEEAELAKVRERSLGGIAIGETACGLSSPDVYVTSIGNSGAFARLTAYGPPPDSTICPPPAVPPTISDQFASSVKSTGAAVRARINPHFWTDTTYYVEYGTGECSAGGCPLKLPLTPEEFAVGTIDKAILTDPIELPGLAPETTYHYRFVAESGGGGPVFGIEGEDATFTTRPATLPVKTDCPNQLFRSGHAAALPDCRAYEMVSPVNKEDGDILVIGDITGYPAGLSQSAVSGDAISYSSYRAFADPDSSPFSSQYLSRRGSGGWSSVSISPPRGPVPILKEGNTLQATFRAFTPDLCAGWFLHDTDPVLDPEAIEGYANLYKDDICGAGGYEAATRATLAPSEKPVDFVPELQGVSIDGSVAIFKVKDKLTPDAANGVEQLYRAEEGTLSLVNRLPGGATCALDASAGTGNLSTGIRTDSVRHALSDDGARTYWSCGSKLYLREAGSLESRKVSETASASASALFWQATPDGGKALFAVNPKSSTERLFVYDAKSGTSIQIAGKTSGILGASDDLSRIYLVSREVKDTGATAEKPNLYLYEGADFQFIATLSPEDAAQNTIGLRPSAANVEPSKHSAAASSDGNAIAFASVAPLTGFDNTDAESGEADTEVFHWSMATGRLSCASCNPTGSRPSGRELGTAGATFWAAAMVPLANSELYSPRVLSADGSKLFFNSFDALTPRDQNEAVDVYEFSPASSQAACEAVGAETYVEEEGGCLSLISTGGDQADSTFVDASPSGRDVFFTTGQSLVPQDPGQIDVYDARQGGGFTPPSTGSGECDGASCQSPAGPGAQPALPSLSPQGGGNVKAKPRCPKGKRAVKRKGKVVCVKKHRKHSKHKSRRASR